MGRGSSGAFEVVRNMFVSSTAHKDSCAKSLFTILYNKSRKSFSVGDPLRAVLLRTWERMLDAGSAGQEILIELFWIISGKHSDMFEICVLCCVICQFVLVETGLFSPFALIWYVLLVLSTTG